MTYSYSIVIPVYNNWQLTHQLLMDLYKVIPPDVEIVGADDCSTQWETRSGLEWWGRPCAQSGLPDAASGCGTTGRGYCEVDEGA